MVQTVIGWLGFDHPIGRLVEMENYWIVSDRRFFFIGRQERVSKLDLQEVID
nr:hypothetical protein [uncultured bacterium]